MLKGPPAPLPTLAAMSDTGVPMTNALPPAAAHRLPTEAIRRICDPATLGFTSTAELTPGPLLFGQQRAAEALRLGVTMNGRGANVYAAGQPGLGKTSAIRSFLEEAAGQRPAPSDWCYVHNFDDPSRPKALRLPAGQGRRLRDDLARLVEAARRELPRAFESEEYISRREAIVNGLNRRREQGMTGVTARAQAAGFLMQPTQIGVTIVPVVNGRPLNEGELAALPAETRTAIDRARAGLEAEVGALFKELRIAERETRQALDAQDREVALHAVGGLVDDLADDYADSPEITAYLADVREGILADVPLFRGHPLPSDGGAPLPVADDPQHALHEQAFRKYAVNVIVDNAGRTDAPVVLEFNPTYPNLIGRIEREVVLGALVTDFTLISPGALHRANGGYLILRIEDLLRAPLSWEALKRALRAGAVTIEDANEALGIAGARGLRPDPIPLDLKVFLLGEPDFYHLLYAADADFRGLFKLRADFDSETERTSEQERAYSAAVLACLTEDGPPLDASAAARLIEESSRIVADQQKLTLRLGALRDLIDESQYWALQDAAPVVTVKHVRRAIEQRRYRSALLPERLQELTTRGVLLVRPEGAAVGQLHGLAVLSLGDQQFGRPSRITASVGAGQGGLLDIERQAELGGKIHSKGVLILGGFLTDRYAQDKPLALTARLVFEQSYSEVEGDSASLAELLTLLSRLAEVPLRQGVAVTGSINQRGEVQAIGGVNEKIEGFYDTCAALGLTGDQGVLMPASNVQHLMLREDVVAAVAAGRFHVYGVASLDEALAVLVAPDDNGDTLSADDVHNRVDAALRRLAEALRDFAQPPAAPPARDATPPTPAKPNLDGPL